jgi:hypothetical protein
MRPFHPATPDAELADLFEAEPLTDDPGGRFTSPRPIRHGRRRTR